MILVTGATGHFGNAAVNFLLQKTSSSNLAILVRDVAKAADIKASGVDVRQGNYDDYESLVKAFKGIDKLLFVSGSEIPKRLQQQTNVVNAAREAGVKHVIYTSFQCKDESETAPVALITHTHIVTEKLIQSSGLTYTILKNAMYTDMIPLFIGDRVLETGTLYLPAGNGLVSYATRNDLAEAAANIITTEGHENKKYQLSGNQSYSFNDIATIISNVSGKPIQYVSPTQQDFTETLTKAGVPADSIGFLALLSEAIKQGEFNLPDTTLEKILGRKPVSSEQFLKNLYTPSPVA